MAAVQPFLSGAISKTCNVPHEATVEDIRGATWKAGSSASRLWPFTATARKEASPSPPRMSPRRRRETPVALAEPAPPAPQIIYQPRRERCRTRAGA